MHSEEEWDDAQPVTGGAGEERRLVDLRILGADQVVRSDYPLAVLAVQKAEENPTLVAVAVVGPLASGELLIAFPSRCWHRTPARRIVGTKYVRKVSVCRVALSDPENRSHPTTVEVRVALGVLTTEGEGATDPVDSFSEDLVIDYPFVEGEPADQLPSAQALVDVSSPSFEFETAVSGGDLPEELPGQGGDFGPRIASLETCFQQIQRDLQVLLHRDAGPGHPKAKASPGETRLREPGNPKQKAAPNFRGLDPAVVRAAQTAGVPDSHLEEMSRLVRRTPGTLVDQPARTNRGRVLRAEPDDPLDDEEYLPEEADAQDVPSDPMQAAVMRLTEIAASLTAQKKKDTSLDALLDASGGAVGSQDGGPGTTARKNAAALMALKERLSSKPRELSENIEKRMLADFALRTALPGTGQVPATWRGWLETRSKVQAYPTTVRFLWALGGVADCLREGRQDEAYTRCLLALMAGDQLSIDRGGWGMASEMSLEDPPPFGAFGVRPLPGGTEVPFSKLVDPRWVDLFISRLGDVEKYLETRKKLASSSSSAPTAPPSTTTAFGGESQEPGARKGKPKGGKDSAKRPPKGAPAEGADAK